MKRGTDGINDNDTNAAQPEAIKQKITKTIGTLLQEVKEGNDTDFRAYLEQQESPILTVLYHNLGDVGAAALAQVLKGTNITTLYLCSNNIGDSGATALAQVLKDTNITTLDLFGNNIGDVGAAALAQILKDTNITDLDLRYNNISDSNRTVVKSLLEVNQSKVARATGLLFAFRLDLEGRAELKNEQSSHTQTATCRIS